MSNEIIRRHDFAGGGITQEEKALLDEHAGLWIGRAMRTDPIEAEKIVPAIHSLYAAASMKTPRVVIVPSPVVMAVAGGFAAAIWYARKTGVPSTFAATRDATFAATDAATYDATFAATFAATDDATDAATRAATHAATRDATRAATYDATRDATFAATHAATRAATHAATRDATRAATDAATRAATYDATDDATYDATFAATDAATRAATYDATRAATSAATDDATYDATSAATFAATDAGWALRLAQEIGGPALAPLMISCARDWYRPYQGGNMWAPWASYLSAFRDVLGLRLPAHEKFATWERAAIEGGYRWMHDEFCMVCDFPEILEVDDRNRPHNANGPSHRWRDGWSLYHWHGVRVPEYVIERPHEITVTLIERETNAEVRRVMIERYGAARYLLDSGSKIISHDKAGILYHKDVHDDEPIVMVRVLNSTPEPDGVMTRDEAIAIFGEAAKAAIGANESDRFKEYMIRVPPNIRTASEAVAWTFPLIEGEYEPVVES